MQVQFLSDQARKAIRCDKCFGRPKTKGQQVFKRPSKDDIAVLPWVGANYWHSKPRIAVMMLNPASQTAEHKRERSKLGHRLRDRQISYQEYNEKLIELVPKWGVSKLVKWFCSIGIKKEKIAYLNIALCAADRDKGLEGLYERCFWRHTREFLVTLAPHVVLLCGKKSLKPYVAEIEKLGKKKKVILTWHYRGMYTTLGKKELRRVRAELEKIGC